MEVNIVRPFVGRALQAIYKHGNPELVPDQERMTNVQSQGHDHGQRVCASFATLCINDPY